MITLKKVIPVMKQQHKSTKKCNRNDYDDDGDDDDDDDDDIIVCRVKGWLARWASLRGNWQRKGPFPHNPGL